LPAGQNPVGIVRLNPALEELGRDRHVNAVVMDALKVHAGKPAGVEILADIGPQPSLKARPLVAFDVCQFDVCRDCFCRDCHLRSDLLIEFKGRPEP